MPKALKLSVYLAFVLVLCSLSYAWVDSDLQLGWDFNTTIAPAGLYTTGLIDDYNTGDLQAMNISVLPNMSLVSLARINLSIGAYDGTHTGIFYITLCSNITCSPGTIIANASQTIDSTALVTGTSSKYVSWQWINFTTAVPLNSSSQYWARMYFLSGSGAVWGNWKWGYNFNTTYYSISNFSWWYVSTPFNETGTWTFNTQEPSDITTLNLFTTGSMNVSYNATNTSRINESFINWRVNNGSCWFYWNGTCQSGTGYLRENVTNISYPTYRWRLDDNDVLPASYMMNESIVESLDHSVFQLTGGNSAALGTFYNLSPNKAYSLVEDMVINNSGTGGLAHYYCNSSYALSSSFASSPYCALFYTVGVGTRFNHTHAGNKSSHVVVPLNINSTFIGSVKFTNTSYIILDGAASTTWNVSYVNSSQCPAGVSKTTGNGGNTWTNLSGNYGCFDMHIHQFNGSDQLCYYADGRMSVNGTQFNSTVRCDNFEVNILPPSSPNITSPLQDEIITANLSVNWTPCFTPFGSITSYTVNITNHGGMPFRFSNVSTNLSLFVNLSHLDNDDDYIVRVTCYDNNSLSAFAEHNFKIDLPLAGAYGNAPPQEWSANLDIDTIPGILLLFFYLAIIVCTFVAGMLFFIPFLIFIASLMTFFFGFIIAFKLSILFGILVTVVGLVMLIVGALMLRGR